MMQVVIGSPIYPGMPSLGQVTPPEGIVRLVADPSSARLIKDIHEGEHSMSSADDARRIDFGASPVKTEYGTPATIPHYMQQTISSSAKQRAQP
jgi:hypothetical protein